MGFYSEWVVLFFIILLTKNGVEAKTRKLRKKNCLAWENGNFQIHYSKNFKNCIQEWTKVGLQLRVLKTVYPCYLLIIVIFII